MKAKLYVKRYPFYSFSYENNNFAFRFEPRIFESLLTSDQEFKFGEFLSDIISELREIREIYYSLKQKIDVKYIEFNKEIQIVINEEKLMKIIEYAKANGLPLRKYAEVLPSINEEEFKRIREYAKRHGYESAISKFLS